MIRFPSGTLLALLLFAPPAGAQKMPSADDWERLHLRVDWMSSAPLESRVDGIRKLQLFGNDLFVQNAYGTLMKLDAATGAEVWRYTPPLKWRRVFPVTVNPTMVFFVNSTQLYYLDRATGKLLFESELGALPSAGPAADSERVYIPLDTNRTVAYRFVELREQIHLQYKAQVESRGPQLGLGFTPFEDLATTGNTAPSVGVLATLRPPFALPGIDAQPSLSSTIRAYPPYTLEGSQHSPSLVMVRNLATTELLNERKSRIEPKRIWDKTNRNRVGYNLLTVEASASVIMPSRAGEVAITDTVVPQVKSTLLTDSDITADVGLHDYTIYVPTADTYLYAYNIKNGGQPTDLPNWRVPTGGEISRAPLVTDDSVFVAGGVAGVRRLDRKTGALLWPSAGYGRAAGSRIPGLDLAAVNSKFLYTVDLKNRFYVVDRRRGTNLSNVDLGDLTVFLANDQDDRIILATPGGKILCLQDKDIRTPVRTKKEPPKPEVAVSPIPPEPKAPPAAAPPKDAPKKPEPKDAMEKKDPNGN